MTDKTPVEMYNELIALGYIQPALVEPFGYMDSMVYLDIPTTLAFATPEVPLWNATHPGGLNAKLGRSSKGDKKRKRRSRNR